MEGLDVREMSFQNVLDTILKPAGVKVGGFPQEMFQDLTEEEAEQYTCNICFLIVNDCRQCDNRHLFCHTCSFAWTMTYGENSQKCPMCRCDQRDYKQNKEVDKILLDKRVHCQEEGCDFRSPLKIFLMHSHGKLKYSNAHVEWESLRPARPQGARLLVLPTLGFYGQAGNRQQRGTVLRNQLQQGRAMIHQMMTLLHLEMQLRQQSLVSYQRAMEPTARVQRLDEVLALNEQLNEIGTILSALLSTPLAGQSVQLQRGSSPDASAGSSSGSTLRMSIQRPSRLMPVLGTADDDDDDDSSSDTSSSDSSLDLSSFGRRESVLLRRNPYPPSSSLNRPPVSSLERTLNEGQAALDQARERREVSQQILSQNSEQRSTPTDPILPGREPGMTPRIGQLSRPRERPRTIVSPREGGHNTVTTTNVLRLSTDNTNTATAGAIASTASSAQSQQTSSSSQLPLLSGTMAAHTMQSTTDALSTASSMARRDQTRQDTPSPVSREPTPPPIPQGSLALRQAMEAMTRSRTPSSTASRTSGTTSVRTTSSNSGAPRHASTVVSSDAHGVRPPSAARSQSRAAGRQSRQAEPSASDGTGQSQAEAPPTVSDGASGQSGAILPASLYRRRQRTESSMSGRSSQMESSLGTTNPSHSVSSVSRNSTGQQSSSRSLTPSLSQMPAAGRRRTTAVPSQASQREAARRANLQRHNPPSSRPAVNRQMSTTSHLGTDSGISSMSSGSGPNRAGTLAPVRSRLGGGAAGGVRATPSGSPGLPKLPGGHARPRRRSEIHQNLLMKK